MAQAKTLSEKELRMVLATIASRRHAARNRAMLLVSFFSGMRVGEIAALKIGDALAADGSIKDRVVLTADQTKGNHDRIVMISDKLRKELSAYVKTLKHLDVERPLFYSQRTRSGFTANTLCQHFNAMYQSAGISGASSHSGRRSFITNLASNGVGVRVLMQLAGHRNLSTTQLYIDVTDQMLSNAVNSI